MLKKFVIMFVIVAFFSVSVFATAPMNSVNAKKEIKLSKNVVTLSPQELGLTIGFGWLSWACAEATGIYVATCVLASGSVPASGGLTAGAALFLIAAAASHMADKCK